MLSRVQLRRVRVETGILLAVGLSLLAVGLLAGCGGGDKASTDADKPVVVLAKVGDTEIKSDYYERKLAKLMPADLPTDDKGQTLDTATMAGKQAFLQVIVNKELMRQKAIQLGYDQDAQIAAAHKSLLAYEAGAALWDDVVGSPSRQISEEELQAYYDQMGYVRVCRYVICNFKEDAEKARDFARTGADWDDVVEQFHDGDADPQGRYIINVPFGQYSADFQDVVWAADAGEVTEVVNTTYGWWVLRVEEVKLGKQKPSLEEAKANILDVTWARKQNRIRNEFKKEVAKLHNLEINESTLWICYQALPDEGLMDPATGEPRAKDTLQPLDVNPADWNLPFYSYTLYGEHVSSTLGDYKSHFDKMSIFQRPKRSELMGGLRQKIMNELERGFMDDEAQKRGYYEDPAVVAKVDEKIEEMMVTKLFGEVVHYDETVSKEEMEAFWSEHGNEYLRPATRGGRLVLCASPEKAAEAVAAINDGVRWKQILTDFGTDQDNKSRSGRIEGVPNDPNNLISSTLFTLEERDVPSDPVTLPDGRAAVIIFESETPGRNMELDEVRAELGERMKGIRREAAFQVLLDKWTAEFGVTVFEDQLVAVDSYEELTKIEVPENLVPRNTGEGS